MKIYVAGHRGLVGSAIARKIELDGKHNWIGKTRSELDLFDSEKVLEFISAEKPDAVVIAAAKVGGIGANSAYPVEFLNENLKIQLNLMEACHKVKTPKVLFLGSSCIYPKFAPQPIVEEALLSGPLEPTNEAYAIAKIAGIKMIEAYSAEYGHKWISAMPTNVYGPFDNFNVETAHVLPALINRFNKAKSLGEKSVTLWGSGKPKREFIHSDDLASASLFLLENYEDSSPINVGTGLDIEIRELAFLIKEITEFDGEIVWDSSKPDGTPRKLLDVSKILELGWSSEIALADGIETTYKWFVENHGRITANGKM